MNNLFGKLIGNSIKTITGRDTTPAGNQAEVDLLRERCERLEEENRLIKQMALTDVEEDNKINKLYSNIKNILFSNEKSEDLSKSVTDYKRFLSEQILFYGMEEDDIESFNKLKSSINDLDWSQNKDLYLFRQRLLESNFNEMFKNLVILNQFQDGSKPKSSKNKDKQQVAKNRSLEQEPTKNENTFKGSSGSEAKPVSHSSDSNQNKFSSVGSEKAFKDKDHTVENKVNNNVAPIDISSRFSAVSSDQMASESKLGNSEKSPMVQKKVTEQKKQEEDAFSKLLDFENISNDYNSLSKQTNSGSAPNNKQNKPTTTTTTTTTNITPKASTTKVSEKTTTPVKAQIAKQEKPAVNLDSLLDDDIDFGATFSAGFTDNKAKKSSSLEANSAFMNNAELISSLSKDKNAAIKKKKSKWDDEEDEEENPDYL